MTPRSILFQIGALALAIVLLVQAISVAVVLLTPPPTPSRMSPARVAQAFQDPAIARQEGWRRVEAREAPFETTAGTGALLASGIAATLGDDTRGVRVRLDAALAPISSQSSVTLKTTGQASVARRSTLSPANVNAIAGAALMSPDFSLSAFEAAWRQPNGQWVVIRPAERAMERWIARLALMLGLSLLLIAPITWWAARRLTRPVRALALAAQQVQIDRSTDLDFSKGPREVTAVAAALSEMRARLEGQLIQRMRMLTAVAHDLRTPLTGLRLRAEQSPPSARDRMARDIARMDAMISEILDYAAVQAGDAAGAEPVDLAALAEEVLDTFAPGSVSLSVKTQAEATAAPQRVRRVLLNLVHNALRYGEDVVVEIGADKEWSIVRVLDRGPGLETQDLEKVFEPFYRLEGSRSRGTGGVGLGLSVGRELARIDNGEIWLEQRDGGGLAAIFRLPIRQGGQV
ncbi:sensor histidine kinase [Brevundimonas diminuta]